MTNPASTHDYEEPVPLIIVEGFFGGSGYYLWRDFGTYLNKCFRGTNKIRRTLFAQIGPISSMHDRACELFYLISGGTVDYGEEHARLHNHSRYGRTHPIGVYPQWSAERPLHFLGHSMGGCTIVKLQDLIREGFFGDEYHPDMLLSVNTISSPFRGSQFVYLLGESKTAAPYVHQLSFGSLLSKIAHPFMYLAPFMPSLLDFHAEARPLSYKDCSIWELIKHIWRSEWTSGKDATPYEVTFEAAERREANGEGVVNYRTYYTSYVACMTERQQDGTHAPDNFGLLNLPLYITSKGMGNFDFNELSPAPSFSVPAKKELELEPFSPTMRVDDNYLANDGVVPTFSQWHPLPCSKTHCQHRHTEKSPRMRSGVWHVFNLEGVTNHLSVVPFWTGTALQKNFFETLGMQLCEMDKR